MVKNTTPEHEIIIVGAGPAGAVAAIILKRLGHDVLLIDKESFPRDKVCGDGMPPETISILRDLGLSEKIDKGIKSGDINPIQKILMVSPRGKYFELRSPVGKDAILSYISPRIFFDTMIIKSAIEEGVEFLQAEVIKPIIEKKFVVGVVVKHESTEEEIRSKLVIGADGAASCVARVLRLGNSHLPRHSAVAIRAYIEGVNLVTNQTENYLYKDFSPGYAWIYPLGKNRANVGVGMRLDKYRGSDLNLNTLLDKFLTMPEIKKRLGNKWKLTNTAPWKLNFGSQKKLQHTFNGALLVGDAAGFINPLLGDGINNALLSAQLAANTAHEALDKNDVSREGLKNYEKACKDSLHKVMRKLYFKQRLFFGLPFLIDLFGMGGEWHKIK